MQVVVENVHEDSATTQMKNFSINLDKYCYLPIHNKLKDKLSRLKKQAKSIPDLATNAVWARFLIKFDKMSNSAKLNYRPASVYRKRDFFSIIFYWRANPGTGSKLTNSQNSSGLRTYTKMINTKFDYTAGLFPWMEKHRHY